MRQSKEDMIIGSIKQFKCNTEANITFTTTHMSACSLSCSVRRSDFIGDEMPSNCTSRLGVACTRVLLHISGDTALQKGVTGLYDGEPEVLAL